MQEELTSRQLKYLNHYNKLINRALNRNLKNKKEANIFFNSYYEEHHIIPTCMNGPDTKNNKVFLLAEEHYTAHLLLVQIHPKVFGLAQACEFMCVENIYRKSKNKSFAWVRRRAAQNQSEKMKGEGNSFFGKKHSAKSLKQMSDKKSGPNNPMYGKPGVNLGKSMSQAQKQLLSKLNTGEKNAMFGKKHSKETITKMRKFDQKTRDQIIHLKNNKIKFNVIKSILEEQGITISLITIQRIYSKEKGVQ